MHSPLRLSMAILAATLLVSASGTAFAEKMIMDHTAMDHTAMATTPTAGLYDKAMTDMHQRMAAAKPTGNPDVDFVTGMIPHHQGAVDMAKIELEKGTDPEIRKLAEGVIAAQEKEITFMKEWLKKHAK